MWIFNFTFLGQKRERLSAHNTIRKPRSDKQVLNVEIVRKRKKSEADSLSFSENVQLSKFYSVV